MMVQRGLVDGPQIAEEAEALYAEVARLTAMVEELLRRSDAGSRALPLRDDRHPSLTAALVAAPHVSSDDRVLQRRPATPLPDPRLLRKIIRHRRLRERYVEPELFGEPAWDILLDLAAARAEHRRVSVTSLCTAAAVAPTTALRWITQMTAMGLLVREPDKEDKRRAFISLSDSAARCMALYFDEIGKDAARLT
jgi:DNA-binding MarR family transcriptional regulator